MLDFLTRKQPVQQRPLPPELIPTRSQPAAAADPGVAVISVQTVLAPAARFVPPALAQLANYVPPSLAPTSHAYRAPGNGGIQQEALAEIAGYLTTQLTVGLGR